MKNRGSPVTAFLSKNWLFVTGVLVAALVVVELMLRLMVAPTTPPVALAFEHGDRNCARPAPGSATTYHRRGILGPGVLHRVNNLGVRNDVPDATADLRVAVLGGSAVYGVGVEVDETLTANLQSHFSGLFPDRGIRFLNLGFPGFNLEEQVRELGRLAPVFKPDIVVVALDRGSFEPALCSRRALPARNLVRDNIALAGILEDRLLPGDLIPGTALAKHASSDDVRRTVAMLRTAHGASLIFLGLEDVAGVRDSSGGILQIADVIAGTGYPYFRHGPDGACPAGNLRPVNSGRDMNPDGLKALADWTACSIRDGVGQAMAPDPR